MLFTLIDTTDNSYFYFPVAPSHIALSDGAEQINIDSIVLGEIPWGRGRKATSIAISGIFPGYKQNIPRNHYADPWQIHEELQAHLDHRPFAKELRLIVTSDDFPLDINMPVYIKTYEPEWKYGDDTILYNIVFNEYRSYRIRRFAKKEQKISTAKESKRPTEPKPKTYTIKSGDTLAGITTRYLGGSARWGELYNLNKDKLRSKNPNLIYPGEILQIPQGWIK